MSRKKQAQREKAVKKICWWHIFRPGVEPLMVHQKKAGRPVPLARYGPLVKRLRHRPLTPVTGVRFPHGSPKESNEITIESNPRGFSRKERLPGAGF